MRLGHNLKEFNRGFLMLTPIAVVIFGLIFGSFLSVCIFRIPYGKERGIVEVDDDGNEINVPAPKEIPGLSICHPRRSFCPKCLASLKWYHNIPLFSWIFLRGKCASCKERIPFRYPLVELLSAICAVLSYYCYNGINLGSILIYLIAASMIVISFIDIDYYIIPDIISIPGILLGLAVGALNHIWIKSYREYLFSGLALNFYDSIIGLALGAGFLIFISKVFLLLRKQEGLGFGDVKLLGMIGAFLGAEAAIITIFLGSLLGSVIGISLICLRGYTSSHPLPFGPYLALGCVCYLYTGADILVALREIILVVIT
jgi:leader peptidase (prepilin peptidase)/N-methyltransferase